MNPPDVSRLAPLYGLGKWEDITPLRPGTASRVWRLSVGGRAYVLRTLPSREQGERQYRLCRHLGSQGFLHTPAILPALDGSPCALLDGKWYHLQAFCPGRRPDPAVPGETALAVSSALGLLGALRDCPAIAAADRFGLSQVWAENRRFWNEAALGMPLSQADEEVAALCAPSPVPSQVIHGDLGPWNLLLDEGAVFVIDFGEARMGDAYFDLASLLGGLLNHTPEPLRPAVLEEFLAAAGQVDHSRLLAQLRLWVWRGVAWWLPQGAYIPQLLSTLRFLESVPPFSCIPLKK